MKRNKFSRTRFSRTRKKDIKFAAYVWLMSVSRISSFSKLIQKKPISKGIKPESPENKTFEAETHQRKNHVNVMHKTPIISLPTLIRIRATDRDGNTIEVTY